VLVTKLVIIIGSLVELFDMHLATIFK